MSPEIDDGFVFLFLAVMMAKEKPPITVVGDVGGRIAIIVVRLLKHHPPTHTHTPSLLTHCCPKQYALCIRSAVDQQYSLTQTHDLDFVKCCSDISEEGYIFVYPIAFQILKSKLVGGIIMSDFRHRRPSTVCNIRI